VQCFILAGGLGTRLSTVAGPLPKTLVPVHGHPFAEYQLRWLREQGVTDIIYSIGHGGENVRAHLGDGTAFGVHIRYVDEGTSLRGTGGALRLASEQLELADAFFVLYGDSLLDLDLGEAWDSFVASQRPVLMTVYRNTGKLDRSNATFDGHTVCYDKRHPSPAMEWIDYGLMVFSREVIERIDADGVVDLCDVLHGLSVAGDLAGFEATRRFYEIGTPPALAEFEQAVSAGKVHPL
jgi:NDP-sugar pyrophosphorylase family protein